MPRRARKRDKSGSAGNNPAVTGEGVTEPSRLSLGAELLMLAIDPANGGLLSRNRGRFREALATSYRSRERRWWSVSGIAR
jgi:hypothetical protein